MALIDDFKARFPQFDTAEVDRLFPYIQSVYPCMYGIEYGTTGCNDQAVLYLCAHIFVVEQTFNAGAGAGGDYSPQKVVNSQSVGSVSVSFESGQANLSIYQQMLNSTAFGQMFLSLTFNRQGAVFV